MPSVSIILPVYNGMRYLEQCVNSVLNQSYKSFEFLIIDDCSTDNSYFFLQSIKDTRIRLYQNEQNKGLFYNLNFLIKESASPIIKLWSQDDVMNPGCIEEIINFHQLHPEIGFSYTGRDHIDADGYKLLLNKPDHTPAVISTALHTRIACITGSIAGNIANVAITKAAIDKVGYFNEQMKISGDFDMWVRIAEYFEVGFINKPLIQLRNHQGQLSNQKKYFIYHLKEDMEVYRYLFSYATLAQKKEGMRLLRSQKLLFYYTLMLKEAARGRIKQAFDFFRIIAQFDNIFILTFFYIKHRVLKIKPVFN